MPETGTVPEMLAVTLPICAVPATNAGSVVSDTGCVAGKLEMLAVTLPICAVPAPMVTVPEMDKASLLLIYVAIPTLTALLISLTALSNQNVVIPSPRFPIETVPLIAGSEPMVTLLPTVTEEMLMGTVPLMDAVTLPICAVPADNAGSELIVKLFPTVTVPPTVTALARSCTSVRPPVTVTCPMVTVMLSSALSDVGPSSTVPVTVLLVA